MRLASVCDEEPGGTVARAGRPGWGPYDHTYPGAIDAKVSAARICAAHFHPQFPNVVQLWGLALFITWRTGFHRRPESFVHSEQN